MLLSFKVKTVVTTLIHRISNVDSELARALAPLYRSANADNAGAPIPEGRSQSYVAAAARDRGAPDWRTLYNQYKVGARAFSNKNCVKSQVVKIRENTDQ